MSASFIFHDFIITAENCFGIFILTLLHDYRTISISKKYSRKKRILLLTQNKKRPLVQYLGGHKPTAWATTQKGKILFTNPILF